MRLWRLVVLSAMMGLSAPAFAAPEAEKSGQLTEANFVPFEPILMSVVQERRIMGLVSIEVTLKLVDSGDWREIIDQRIRLKDRLVQAVGGMTRGAIRVDMPLNIDLITAVLQRQVDGVIGPDRAQVLIVDASTRIQ